MSVMLDFFTGASPHNAEIRIFGMAFLGAMAVRNGPNKDRKMNWFHALALQTMVAFGGGWFGFLWMGKPTSLLTGADITLTACMISYLIVNCSPMDIGYKLGNTLPAKILATSLAQLFRCMGMIGFISAGAKEISATPYYPIPVLGPILWGCLLGNMGGFFAKGFDGHLQGGMPWPFQNNFFVGAVFHFLAHDQDGPVGTFLRDLVHSIFGDLGGLDDKTFGILFASVFMQVTGILQLPDFLGPSWSPFNELQKFVTDMLPEESAKPQEMEKRSYEPSSPKKQSPGAQTTESGGKKKKKKKKKA